MSQILTGLFELWTWLSGSALDIFQTIGALATAGALVAIIFQTKSMNKQTELLDNEMDYRLRPWLYPVDTEKHMELFIRVSEDSSKNVLGIRVEKSFKNAGRFPTKKVNIYVTGSDKRIENFKSDAYMSDQTAVFPKQTFRVHSQLNIKILHLLDRIVIPGKNGLFERYKLDKHIYIGILLEYEYGSGKSKKAGYYKGLFRVDRLQHHDTQIDMVFFPIFDIVNEDVG